MPLPLGNGNALAFDATDELYFANGFVLATIDPASAAVLTTTPLTFPPLGCFALWVEAMDPLPDGRFLASLTCDFSHSVLATLDPETGVVSAGPATVSGVGGVAYRTCGNGIVDPGEECDDGNTEDGDCCDHACGAGIEGTPCADDGDGCTDDQCDAAGVCRHPPNTAPCDDADPCTTGDTCSGGLCEGGSPVDCGACQACLSGIGCRAAPRTDCRLSMVGGKSKLLLSDGALSADRHRVRWSWRKGAATTLADLGDPRTGTDYALCVFDRTGGGDHLVLSARMPSGNAWRSARGGGFTFASPDAIPDGLRHVEVRSGSAGAARISLRDRGPIWDSTCRRSACVRRSRFSFGPWAGRASNRDTTPRCVRTGASSSGHRGLTGSKSRIRPRGRPCPCRRSPFTEPSRERFSRASSERPGARRLLEHPETIVFFPIALQPGACAPPADVVVPLRGSSGRFRRRSVTLRTETVATREGLLDRDGLKLTRAPAS